MSKMTFDIPQRQSPVAILLILSKFFSVLLRQAWPLAVVFFFNSKSNFWNYAIYFGILAAFVTAVLSIISYFKFYYYIQDEELVIEKGVLQKTKLNVPFDRIQTINFQQNVIHQFFQVVSLEIDTAGSSEKEFSISALEKKQAESIRRFVLEQKALSDPPAEEPIEELVQEKPAEEKLIFRLSPLDLLKTGVSQNHFRMGGIIIATLFGLYQFSSDLFGDKKTEGMLKGVFGVEPASIFQTLLLILPFFLLLSIILTLINTILQYFDLRLYKTERGFKTIAGLLTRRELSATLQKIQWIRWGTNPIMRLFKQYRLQLAAASSDVVRRRQAMAIPGCYEEQIESVRDDYFPSFRHLDKETHGISKAIISRHLLYFGLPPILIGPLLFNGLSVYDLLWLLWIPVVYLLSRRFHQKWKWHLSTEGLRTDKGIFGSQATLLQWYKVQSVAIEQSPYQRRKSLANIYFYTAAGTLTIPYISLEDAHKLRNFVLYKVESDPRKWM
ncbi:MAG: PH domain-containing protein [Bacteroidota bacterium]